MTVATRQARTAQLAPWPSTPAIRPMTAGVDSTCCSSRPARKVRVPPGVMLFDAASWNGIAIDSTCGGHGTCRKCKVKVLDGTRADHVARHARPSRPTSSAVAGGSRVASRSRPTCEWRCPRSSLARRRRPSGVGRKVILRPAVQKRYVELTEPTLSDQTTDLERLFASLDDLELRPDLHVLRSLGTRAARERLQGDRGRGRRRADRCRAGRHERPRLRHRLRPRHDDRRRDVARPVDRDARSRCSRCSTPSSRSAPT